MSDTFTRPFRRSGSLGTVLVLLALWVQALAPLASLRMALAAPGIDGAILCGHPSADGAIGVAVEQPATPPSCDLCRLCRAGMAPPPRPDTPSLSRLLRWTALAWPIPAPFDRPSASRGTGQPRAPPITA